MAIVGFILKGLAGVLSIILNFLFWVLLARMIISWINADPYNPIVRFIFDITEQLLRPIRRYIPPVGAFDLSFFVLCLVIYFLSATVPNILMYYGEQLIPRGGF